MGLRGVSEIEGYGRVGHRELVGGSYEPLMRVMSSAFRSNKGCNPLVLLGFLVAARLHALV